MKEADRLRVLKLGANAAPLEKRSQQTRARASRVAPGSYAEKLLQAGIPFPAEIYLAGVILGSVSSAMFAYRLGLLLSVFAAGTFAYYFLILFVGDRAEKRRRTALPQLPTFIDALASAISTGYNLEAAIINAASSVPEGVLREELDRVVNSLKRGLSLEESVHILTHRIQGKEIVSLAVAITLFYGMGGRILEPFKRLARKIREQQQVVGRAQRDLVQVKLAFHILFVLSMLAPALLLIVQPGYLAGAMNDGFGRVLIQLAIILELAAFLIFKKVTTIRI